MTDATWNLKEAATALGVGRETLRRAILAGELSATHDLGPGPSGKSYRVDCQQARRWLQARLEPLGAGANRGDRGEAIGEVGEPDGEKEALFGERELSEELARKAGELREEARSFRSEQTGAIGHARIYYAEESEQAEEAIFEVTAESGETSWGNQANRATGGAPSGSVPLAAHLDVLALVSKTMDRFREMETTLAAERAIREDALSFAEREHRRAESLVDELRGYQRALGEQAESLAEERARRMALELAAADVVDQAEAILPEIESTMSRLPTAAGNAPRAGGWGRRLKRWFLGEKTG